MAAGGLGGGCGFCKKKKKQISSHLGNLGKNLLHLMSPSLSIKSFTEGTMKNNEQTVIATYRQGIPPLSKIYLFEIPTVNIRKL